MARTSKDSDPVGEALKISRRKLAVVGIFSGAVNLLMLSSSLYMLQVYDRVLPSRSVETLVALTIILVAAFALQGFLEAVRTRMLARIGNAFDASLQRPIHNALVLMPLRGARSELATQPLRDLDQIRGFLSSMGPTAFMDLPWMPIFLVTIFLLHPSLGILVACGAVIIVALTLWTERSTAAPTRAALEGAAHRQLFADALRRNAEAVRGLGMLGRFGDRWVELNNRYLLANTGATDVAANLGSAARVVRLLLQSATLGLGAYLVVKQQATGGVMIAASILASRALAPVEIAIASWRQFAASRLGVKRLREILKATRESWPDLTLPRPEKFLEVEALTVMAPGTNRPIVQNASFKLAAGAGLAVIGASASGKSTLARALVGVWPIARGTVRLDGATLDQWAPDELGLNIGYLPQEAALFDGTIAQNIARFEPDALSKQIIEAAKNAGAHDLILRMPEGYETRVGDAGSLLSAGQRQRVGLARAAYGSPFMIVLDEPNANLDHEGDQALTGAIRSMREAGSIVIVVSHRPSALAALEQVLIMADGQVKAFGPRDEVLRKFTRQQPGGQGPGGPPPAADTPHAGAQPAGMAAGRMGNVLRAPLKIASGGPDGAGNGGS